MRRTHLTTVERAVRAKVCSGCPNRTRERLAGGDTARACEADCRLFRSLPTLWRRALRVDPMVGRFGQTMCRAVAEAEGTAAGGVALPSRRGREVAAVLGQLAGY